MSRPIPSSVSRAPRRSRTRRNLVSPLPHLRRHWVRWAIALALGLLLALTVASAGHRIELFNPDPHPSRPAAGS